MGRGPETAPALPSLAADPDPPWEGLALPQRLRAVLAQAFTGLRRSVPSNLVVVTEAFLLRVRGGRRGQGRLSLHALTRQLRTPGRPQSRYQRRHRFVDCRQFDPPDGMSGVVWLALGTRPGRRVLPVLVDQTPIGMVQVLHLGTPYRGRVLPLGCCPFVSPLPAGSQNQLEELAFAARAPCLPAGVRPLWIHARGSARGRLVEAFTQAGERFISRGRAEVGVGVDGRGQRLGGLAAGLPPGVAGRFTRGLSHTTRRPPVDLVCYRAPAFPAPWALVLPAGSEAPLSTPEALQAYRERMPIEQGPRDWKTHLGVRGLPRTVRQADRLARVRMAFAIASALGRLLGASQLGEPLREQIEIRRVRPRQGTPRTLSIVTLGWALLATPRHLPRAWTNLLQLLDALREGAGILSFRLAAQPP